MVSLTATSPGMPAVRGLWLQSQLATDMIQPRDLGVKMHDQLHPVDTYHSAPGRRDQQALIVEHIPLLNDIRLQKPRIGPIKETAT